MASGCNKGVAKMRLFFKNLHLTCLPNHRKVWKIVTYSFFKNNSKIFRPKRIVKIALYVKPNVYYAFKFVNLKN